MFIEKFGESDGKIVYAKPAPSVITALKAARNLTELQNNLPYEI
jgi:hypothetical protein